MVQRRILSHDYLLQAGLTPQRIWRRLPHTELPSQHTWPPWLHILLPMPSPHISLRLRHTWLLLRRIGPP